MGQRRESTEVDDSRSSNPSAAQFTVVGGLSPCYHPLAPAFHDSESEERPGSDPLEAAFADIGARDPLGHTAFEKARLDVRQQRLRSGGAIAAEGDVVPDAVSDDRGVYADFDFAPGDPLRPCGRAN